MPRMLIMTAQREDGETEIEVDNQGLLAAMGAVTQMWGRGDPAPGIDTHVEKVRLVDEGGSWKGFAYYVVAGEPRNLSGVKEQVVES